MIAIVESRADRASSHVCRHLLELADWEERVDPETPDAEGGGTYYRTDGAELRSFDALHLDLERPAEAFDADPEPDLLVFASRHSGNTGPLLTAHSTGNFGPAEFGGEPDAVAEAAPNALSTILETFDRHAPEGYDTGLECTHHGPTDVGCPSLFAELGSDDAQWDDPEGARAVAKAILELRGVATHRRRTFVGFGGNHYVPRFERIVRETPWSVGHVAADWALEAMGDPADHREAIQAAFAASDADRAVVDGEWPALEATVEDLGYRVVSETWLREVGDRPLALVDAVESRLGAVDDGVRFGSRRTADFAVADVPTELLEAAEAVDAEAVRASLESTAVAFETRNGGSRVGGRAAFPTTGTAGEDPLESIVRTAAAVLEDRYETVDVRERAVVVGEVAFDPALAREAGVQEGPKFGRLSAGEDVTVEGTTVRAEDVSRERSKSFPWNHLEDGK